tara:strand:- start:906 stop:1028 length:123 start_codon:yes stop_codon:yes gene_type:complete
MNKAAFASGFGGGQFVGEVENEVGEGVSAKSRGQGGDPED